MVSLLSRSRAFGSARFTGLNALRGPGAARVEERPEEAAIERARLRRAARAARTQRPGVGSSGVVLLEKDLDEDVERDTADVHVPADAQLPEAATEAPVELPREPTAPPAEPDSVPASAETEAGPLDAESGTRERRVPQPGTAAERAAARRAKLRAERSGDSKGKS
jgi:preprotein translocase subunit SecD